MLAWECPSGTIPWSVNSTRMCCLHLQLCGGAVALPVQVWAVLPRAALNSGAHFKIHLWICCADSGWRCHVTRGCAQLVLQHPQHLLPSITCCGSVGVPVAANGSALVEMEAKFLGSNARICAFTGRHKGLCFFYSSRNKRLVVVVAFVC